MHDLMAIEGTEEGSCSICLDNTSGNCDRTIVRLRCSHVFHLDCIGSAFNATGVMLCPKCRQRENGIWRRFPYTHIPDYFEELTDDDEEEPLRYAPMPQFRHRHTVIDQRAWRIVPREIGGHMDDPFVPIMLGERCTFNLAPIRPQPSAPIDSVCHPLSDQGGPSATNGSICQKMQPFSDSTASMAACPSSAASAIIASMAATGASSNSFPMPLRDDLGWRRPYGKSPSPPVVASMESGSKLITCSEFHWKKTYTGSSSSEQMMTDIFHAGAGGSSSEPSAFGHLIRRRHEGSSSDRQQGDWFDEWLAAPPSANSAEFIFKNEMASDSSLGKAARDLNYMASISISSSDNDAEAEEVTIHSPARSAPETHDDDNMNADASNFEYPLD